MCRTLSDLLRPSEQRQIAREARRGPYYGAPGRTSQNIFDGTMFMTMGGLTDDHPFDSWLSHLRPPGDIPWYLGDGRHFSRTRNTQQRNFLINMYARTARWLARARREIANEINLPLRKVRRYVKGRRLLRIVNPTDLQNPQM